MTTASMWWRRWTAVTTAGELIGFAVPATIGGIAATAAWPDAVAFSAVLGAGFIEGSVLGYAQARVWHDRLPALDVSRYAVGTGLAAVLAYALGLLPSNLGDRLGGLPVPLVVAGGLVAGSLLLASIGTAQWLVLRRAGLDRPMWILTTAGAWTAGLAVFLLTAMPLWQPGQSWWIVVGIGVGCGALMAVTVAAFTGLAAVRLLRSSSRGAHHHDHLALTRPT